MALINYFHFKDVALDILYNYPTSNKETEQAIKGYIKDEHLLKSESLIFKVNRAYKKYCDDNKNQVRFKWCIRHSNKVLEKRIPKDNTIREKVKRMYENGEIDLNPLFQIDIYTYEGLNGVIADIYQDKNTKGSLEIKTFKAKQKLKLD